MKLIDITQVCPKKFVFHNNIYATMQHLSDSINRIIANETQVSNDVIQRYNSVFQKLFD